MAKKQQTEAQETTAEQSATVEVRALVDCAAYGMLSGMLAVIPRDALEPLKAAGVVDDHPDAVAYAKQQQGV